MATHDTATSLTKFDDEDLFNFLVKTYQSQPILEKTALATSKPDTTREYWLEQVVNLFELARKARDSEAEELVREMEVFLLLRSDTTELVLRAWLLNKELPGLVWHILFPVDVHDLNLVYLWLRYVELLRNHEHSYPYSYNAVYAFLEGKLSKQQMAAVLPGYELK
ncbi:uncharacterized protein PHALS_07786 [Plasmopara halstedii]|uniref:Uncharacterized protein n=1 Tax=Plasmopara halstedii TaxID=4781 RepID=A0A0P1B6E5_PLAHL|nr:uncharacterized protein PHALS_07786 [Plasmopara halstedii]CEG50057.1 hypothetical protein PHALS_07786 [Plasmopara halstedii]|eukprot:XP_024586426.1 hypothetical protein PHALS_07786 [Plasmopara halstedii]